MSERKRQHDQRGDVAVAKKPKPKTKKPKNYIVILHNDDYTSMEFVVQVLETVFHKSPSEAAALMLQVHQTGRGIAGTYSREVAESKVAKVHAVAQRNGYPLRASYEPA